MTNLTIFAIAFLICLLGVIIGRISLINGINQRLKVFKTEKFPIIDMCNLYRVLRTIISDLDFERTSYRYLKDEHKFFQDENKELHVKYDKLSDDYKDVLKQLKDKREEYERLDKYLDRMSEDKMRYQDKCQEQNTLYNGFISKVYYNAEMIANAVHIVYDDMSNLSPLVPIISTGIYATKLKNKSVLLSIGTIKVAGNGKITYQDGGRSLGLLTSNENKWAQGLLINTDLPIGQPYLISVIYPNDFVSRIGDIQSKLHDIQGDACKMKSHISDNKNLLNI